MALIDGFWLEATAVVADHKAGVRWVDVELHPGVRRLRVPDDVEAHVKAAWKAAVSGDVDAQTEVKSKTKKSYHVQIATVGTTGATTFRAAGGLKDAMDELTATANYSEANPGAVISYALRYLLDGTVAKAVLGPYSYTDLIRC